MTDDAISGCLCESCPLQELGREPVLDDGNDSTILAVGEAPGKEEDRKGIPFVGESGRRLRDALRGLGYPMDKITFTNVVKCRPPENKIKAKHIKCCYRGLPITGDTRLVLLLGNTPLKAVLGESGISMWNGVTVERDGIIYAPVYHPAYTLHNSSPDVLDAWLDALDNALTLHVSGSDSPADYHILYEYPISDNDVQAMCDDLMAADIISFDTEVSSLDPYHTDNRMLAMSFSDGAKAWAIFVDTLNDCSLWCSIVDYCISDTALDMIANVLTSHQGIIGHNIKFDQMMVDQLLNIQFEAYGDTMLVSLLVDSKKGIHSLKRLAGYYLGMFEYDSELGDFKKLHKEADYDRGGSYSNIPMEILWPYAAMDASATWLLHPILYDKLNDRQRVLYHQLIMPTSNALYRLQLTGMVVDHDVADRYRRLYGTVKASILDKVRQDAHVIRYVDAKYAKYKKDHPKGRLPRDRFEFNPGSNPQKSVILYDKKRGYGLKPLGLTDTGQPSCKRDYLETYRYTVPIVDQFIMYGMMDKVLGTYILPVATGSKLSADGRARSNFNIFGTVTGRLSSSRISPYLGFNQQNIPTPEKEAGTILQYQPIKNMFTHTWDGGCVMSVDYSGMELRVFASLANCEPMLDIHRSGEDFHTMVAVMASGIPKESITKPMRYRYKWTNWTILYRGNAGTLQRIYGIPLEEGQQTIDMYMDRFPEVEVYAQECIAFAREYGYIDTPFGNRRSLPDIHAPEAGRRNRAEREAVNTPTQGAAGLVTLMALVIIDYMMYVLKFKSKLNNTVHDSIVTDVYPGEVARLSALQADIMENIIEYAAWFMPDIDMSWMICPLKADIEVGSHYGNISHYTPEADGKWWAERQRQYAIGGKYG